MSANSYFKCYPSDFLNGVIGLSAQEIGVYAVLMMQQYDRRGGVPENVRALAARCMLRPTVAAGIVGRLIEAGKLVLKDGLWSNPRAAREIDLLNSSATVSQQNGTRGGRKPKGKTNEINGGQNLELTQKEPDTRYQKPEAPNGAARACATREGASPGDEPSPDLAKRFEQRILEAAPTLSVAYARSPGLFDLSPVHRWLGAGCDLETEIIAPIAGWFARNPGKAPPRTWKFFDGMVTDAAANRFQRPVAAGSADPGHGKPFDAHGRPAPWNSEQKRCLDEQYRTAGFDPGKPDTLFDPADPAYRRLWWSALKLWNEQGLWQTTNWGPKPDQPGCLIPASFLEMVKAGEYDPRGIAARPVPRAPLPEMVSGDKFSPSGRERHH